MRTESELDNLNELWHPISDFKDRGQLTPLLFLPKEVHNRSWALGYQIGLHDAVKYGSLWWWIEMKWKVSENPLKKLWKNSRVRLLSITEKEVPLVIVVFALCLGSLIVVLM